MFIEKIHIDTFGKLSDFELELTPGVNIIEGDNESGKSTLAAFIKFIFYGVSARERQEIMSWKTGGAAGSLTVSVDSHRYRIERAIVGSREAVQLVDGENNMPIRNVPCAKTPGELFFGVDADMFSATAFVSQLGGTSVGGAKLSEGIENILFSADESINTQRAAAKLDAARAALLHKNEKGGQIYELDNECAMLEVKLADALRIHGEILSGEAQLADAKERLEDASAKADTLKGKIKHFEANALLELFERRRLIESRLALLRGRLESENAQDAAVLEEMEEYRSRLSILKKELDDITQRYEECNLIQPSRELEEFTDMGGRAGVISKIKRAVVRSRVCTVLFIILILAGIVAGVLGIMPMIGGGQPDIILMGACIASCVVAVVLMFVGKRAGTKVEEIRLIYDIDALEAEESEYNSVQETAKFTSLALADARRRYSELCDDIKRRYGCAPEELSLKCQEKNKKSKESTGIRADYDKNSSLLAQIDAQLEPYSEEELRSNLSKDIDISDVDVCNLSAMRREAEFAAKMASSLEKHCAELEKGLAGLYPAAEDPRCIADKLSSLKAERTVLHKKHSAYKLAIEKLNEASDSLRNSIAPRLASDAARNMELITEGKYKNLGVGADLTMSAETESGQRTVGVLSAGTQDAAYLSLRLALISLLYRKTEPMMIYDESFVKQDQTRLSRFLSLISRQKNQSIIFTACDREAKAMSAVADFRHIKM